MAEPVFKDSKKWRVKDLTELERRILKNKSKVAVILKFPIKDFSYCGPAYMPEKLRAKVSGTFNEACLTHDIDYEEKETSRLVADEKFLKNMLEIAADWKEKLLAYSFYYAVRAFGRFSWG